MSPRRPQRPQRRSRKATARPAAGRTLRDQARVIYRDAIFDAAAEVLAERGYAKTRMQDVAARAGVATGSLYNYFASKAELTASMLEHRARQAAAAIDAILDEAAAEGSIVERLIRASLAHLDQNRALISVLEDGAAVDGELGGEAERCDRMKEVYLGALRGALEAATARGELRRGLSLDDVAVLLGGMFKTLARHAAATGSSLPLVERAPLVIDFFLNGAGRRTR